jgi:hypothetical protein
MATYFANMSPMVTKAVKGAAVGAGVGFALWLARQVVPRGHGGVQFEELNDAANSILVMDADFRSLCMQLRPFGMFDPECYSTLLLNVAKLVHTQVAMQRGEMKVHFGLTREAAQFASEIVECVRRLRAILTARNGHVKVMADFDEIAADVQRKCNEYMHNISMAVQYALTC